MEMFYLIYTKPAQSSVHFTVRAPIRSNQLHFKVLNGHIWLAATIRDSTVLPGCQDDTELGPQPGCDRRTVRNKLFLYS